MEHTLSRRSFLRLAAAVSASIAAAACAPKPTPAPVAKKEEPAVKQEAPTAAPAAKGPVVIQLHMRAGGEQSEVPIYVTRPEEFMKEHPEIKVELSPLPGGEYMTKIQTMAAAQTLGDVTWSSDVWTDHTRMVKLGIIAVADDYLDKFGKKKDEWLPACVDTLTHEGKMYGLPKCSHPGDCYVWINEEMFEEAGLPVPEQYGNTPEQLMEWAAKLTKGPDSDREVYGYLPATGHIMALYNPLRQFGGLELSEDGSKSLADSEQWLAWAQWTSKFYEDKLAPLPAAIPEGGPDSLFAAGKLAMHHNQRYMNRRVKLAVEAAAKPFKWRVIQFPRGAKPRGWTACVDTHSAIASSKHPEEAFLLSYALADQRFTYLVARDIGYLGGRVDDKDSVKDLIAENPFLAVQYECMIQEEKFRQPSNARGREVETVLKNEMDKIWLSQEKLTPDFMKRLKNMIDEVLAKPF